MLKNSDFNISIFGKNYADNEKMGDRTPYFR